MTEKLKVERTRNFSAHHMLIGAARAALEDAEKKMPGWFYNELIAMVMCALSIEAISNAVGERVIPNWRDFESSSPIAKLRIICQKLEIEYGQNKEPWSTAKWLSKFRNSIAHAKPELVDEEQVWTREEYEKRRADHPKSKIESDITLGNAKRALQAVERIKDLLCEKIPADDALGLYSDAWVGSAKLANDD